MERKDLKLFIKAASPIMVVLYIVLCLTKGFWTATLGMTGTLAGVAAMLVWTFYVIDREERNQAHKQRNNQSFL